jgi:hypothetical protein
MVDVGEVALVVVGIVDELPHAARAPATMTKMTAATSGRVTSVPFALDLHSDLGSPAVRPTRHNVGDGVGRKEVTTGR